MQANEKVRSKGDIPWDVPLINSELTCHLRDGILQIDGKALVKDGSLQTPG